MKRKPTVENVERFKDDEDRALERDPDFWKMIHERRADPRPGIPLEEARRQLGLPPSSGSRRRSRDSKRRA